MKAILVLGCEGHTDKDTGFMLCSCVKNTILDLESVKRTQNYIELINYLDKVPKLFDGVCFKMNVITNTIYKIYELGYIEERVYKYIAYFYEKHQHCGMYLDMVPK